MVHQERGRNCCGAREELVSERVYDRRPGHPFRVLHSTSSLSLVPASSLLIFVSFLACQASSCHIFLLAVYPSPLVVPLDCLRTHTHSRRVGGREREMEKERETAAA